VRILSRLEQPLDRSVRIAEMFVLSGSLVEDRASHEIGGMTASARSSRRRAAS